MTKATILPVLALALCTACAPKSEVTRLQTENSRLQAQVMQLQVQVTQLQARAAQLQDQLMQRNTQLSQANTELARKPSMPVRISFRRAVMGSGNVVVLNTLIKADFPALVIFKSKSLGTTKTFQVNLHQNAPTELGHMEGATIYPGDEITVENQQFEAVSAVCPG